MFKVILKDWSDTIHETKVFQTMAEAEILIKHWYEMTSGAVRGFIEEVEDLPKKIVAATEAKKEVVEVDIKADAEKIIEAEQKDVQDAKKVLDKA